jgi:hypothetical protein
MQWRRNQRATLRHRMKWTSTFSITTRVRRMLRLVDMGSAVAYPFTEVNANVLTYLSIVVS